MIDEIIDHWIHAYPNHQNFVKDQNRRPMFQTMRSDDLNDGWSYKNFDHGIRTNDHGIFDSRRLFVILRILNGENMINQLGNKDWYHSNDLEEGN